MFKNFWVDRPPTPVILAWMTFGMLATVVIWLIGYVIVNLVDLLTG